MSRLNEARVEYGARAVDAGSADRDTVRSDATDTVTNVLHFLRSEGEPDPVAILSSAAASYLAESGEERPGRTVVLSDGAYRAVCGLVQEDEDVDPAQVVAGAEDWRELRQLFPLSDARLAGAGGE